MTHKYSEKRVSILVIFCLSILSIFLLGRYFAIKKAENARIKSDQLSAQNQMLELELALDELRPKIGGFPPSIDSDQERQEVEVEFNQIADEASRYIKEHEHSFSEEESVHYFYLLGELYRMGHNLDLHSSWKLSEYYFQKGIDLDSNSFENRMGLATLYVNTGFEFADDAELLMLETLEKDISDEEKVSVYQNLFFAYYYQSDKVKAKEMIDHAIRLSPEDESLKTLQNIIKTTKEEN